MSMFDEMGRDRFREKQKAKFRVWSRRNLIRISKKQKHRKTNFHVRFAFNSINPVCRKINLHVRSGMEIHRVMSVCQMRGISKSSSREIWQVRCGENWNGRQRSGTVFLRPKTKSIRITPFPATFARALRFWILLLSTFEVLGCKGGQETHVVWPEFWFDLLLLLEKVV